MRGRKPHADPVTPELRNHVIHRDGTQILLRMGRPIIPVCVAPMLSQNVVDPCFGPPTLDHVKDHAMMGKRAPSDEAHLVTICAHHHLDGWATSHRWLLRWYLRTTYENENPAPSVTEASE